MDNFKFLVKDSKPNVVSDNVFHIQWSLISFEHKRSVPRAPLGPCDPSQTSHSRFARFLFFPQLQREREGRHGGGDGEANR